MPNKHWVLKDGKLHARLSYRDAQGKRKQKWRAIEKKSDAKPIVDTWIEELALKGPEALRADKVTMRQLCRQFIEQEAVEARYVGGRKVHGYRSRASIVSLVKVVEDYFGDRRVRSIDHNDCRQFKLDRLQVPCRKRNRKTKELFTVMRKDPDTGQLTPAQRAIATINRELACLRRLLNYAMGERWIFSNPFNGKKPLISVADEEHRQTIATPEQQEALLKAARRTDARADHLYPMLVWLFDTGCRAGEELLARWRDIDWEEREIKIHAVNTKTLQERVVPLSDRLCEALLEWREKRRRKGKPCGEGDLIFGLTSNIRRSWATAKAAVAAAEEEAGVAPAARLAQDFRLHDARHTHATNLVDAGIPLTQVGNSLGHTEERTMRRYVNQSKESVRRIRDAVNQRNQVQATDSSQ